MCLHAGTWDGIFLILIIPSGRPVRRRVRRTIYRQSVLLAAHSGKYNSWLRSTMLQSERPDLNHFLNVFEQHVP